MSKLHVGLSQVDITPPVGVELCGFGPYLARKSTAVLEPLYARAAVFRLGRTRLALVELDLISIRREQAAAIRRRITRMTGIPGKNVMLCCTHTHSGPATAGTYIAWGEPDRAYLRRLPARVARAVVEADKGVRPARLFFGEATLRGLAVNRVADPKHVDRRLAVVRIDAGGRTVGFIAHASIHPVCLCAASTVICGDFVGRAINAVAKEFPGSTGLYLQGACGDINVPGAHQPAPKALKLLRRHSAAFAAAIRAALKRAKPMRVGRLKSVLRTITLPQARPAAAEVLLMLNESRRTAGRDDCPDDVRRWGRFIHEAYSAIFEKLRRGDRPGYRTEIQGFALGSLVLLAHPAELYVTFYEQLRRKLGGRRLILAGYANDCVGYVPDRAGYGLDSPSVYAPFYVPIIAGEYRFREDVGEVLLRRLLALSESLTR